MMNIPDFPEIHVLKPRYDVVRPKSHAGRQWMIDACKNRELIRRKGGKFAVVYVRELSSGGFEAYLQEVFLLNLPNKREIPAPGFYY